MELPRPIILLRIFSIVLETLFSISSVNLLIHFNMCYDNTYHRDKINLIGVLKKKNNWFL